MTAYWIRLSGCDDSTVFMVELTDADARAAQRLAALSRENSAFSCQPIMTISPAGDDQEVTA